MYKRSHEGQLYARPTQETLGMFETPSRELEEENRLTMGKIEDFPWFPDDNVSVVGVPDDKASPEDDTAEERSSNSVRCSVKPAVNRMNVQDTPNNVQPLVRKCFDSMKRLGPEIHLPFLTDCRGTIAQLVVQRLQAITGLEDRLYALDQMIPVVFHTVAAGTQLAVEMYGVAKKLCSFWKRLVSDEYLQHQGGAASMMDWEGCTHSCQKLLAEFENAHSTYERSVAGVMQTLTNLGTAVLVMAKIPLLVCLNRHCYRESQGRLKLPSEKDGPARVTPTQLSVRQAMTDYNLFTMGDCELRKNIQSLHKPHEQQEQRKRLALVDYEHIEHVPLATTTQHMQGVVVVSGNVGELQENFNSNLRQVIQPGIQTLLSAHPTQQATANTQRDRLQQPELPLGTRKLVSVAEADWNKVQVVRTHTQPVVKWCKSQAFHKHKRKRGTVPWVEEGQEASDREDTSELSLPRPERPGRKSEIPYQRQLIVIAITGKMNRSGGGNTDCVREPRYWSG